MMLMNFYIQQKAEEETSLTNQ